MIKIVNKYKEPNHIYCGRGSALGNPYPITKLASRDLVCDKYITWFYEHVDSDNFLSLIKSDEVLNPQMTMLRTLFKEVKKRDINLGCFCAPKRCHCETIKEFLELQLNKEY